MSAPLVATLGRLLASTFVMSTKAHNFHWNVGGPMFQVLHAQFGDLYAELDAAVDLIAERVRALGNTVPGRVDQLTALSSVRDVSTMPMPAMGMVSMLLEDHNIIGVDLRAAMTQAKSCEDEGTLSLLADRQLAHEKSAWMLRSTVQG